MTSTTGDTSKTTAQTPAPVTLSSSTTLPNVATTTLQITIPPAAKPAANNPTTQTQAAAMPDPLGYANRCDPNAQKALATKAATQKAAADKAAAAAAAAAKAAGKAPAAPPATNAVATFTPDIHRTGAGFDLRLHSVALPEIAVASVTDEELAAAAPVSGFLAKIGLSGSSNVGLDISLSGIEEVHLPFKDEYKLFQDQKGPFVTTTFPPGMFLEYIYQKRPDLLPAACFVDPAALNASKMLVLVANEVVYAHSIDYAYRSGSTFAGQLSASLISKSAASPKTASTASTGPDGNTTTVTTNVTTDAPETAAAATKPSTPTTPTPSVVDATQTALAAATTSLNGLVSGMSGPGGTLQVGIGRTGNLTMSEKFAQPMAFGVGDLLEFSPDDLLRLYRRTAIVDGSADNKSLIASSVTMAYELFCDDSQKPKDKLSLEEYVLDPNADVARLAPRAKPVRFRPFEGLPL